VDGFIVISTATHRESDYLPGLQTAGIPIVLINRAATYPYFDQINWDSGKGVLAATRHLVALGHRRIAHLEGPPGRLSSTIERMQGYRAGLAEAGLPFNPDYVQGGDFTAPEETWRQAMRTLLDLSPRPTALIAADHRTAAVSMKTAIAAGLRVPHDMAIIGIDDVPLTHYLEPALTTLRLPIQEAGQLAVELLLGRLAGRSSPPEQIMLDCPLVIRDSCGASLTGSPEQ
jgi:LacI family transcriptional regulator